MVQTLSVNSNHDLFLDSSGNISVSRDLQALLQQCEQVVMVRVGELMFNTDRGVIGLNSGATFGNTPNLSEIDAKIRQSLLDVEQVEGINQLDISIANNRISYTASILTSFGLNTISSSLE